ncbi:hypothetical protein CL656_06270 [bacterium]|nr:hypothetical protein [bacterium]
MNYKEENKKSLKILDCTLRDGGYYNNWDFDIDLIREHIDVIRSCNIDILELGFRSLINDQYKGPLAFTRDDFLEKFDSKNLKIAVMVNIKEFENHNEIKNKINRLFPFESNNSKVDIIRLACTYEEIDIAKVVYQLLKEKGFEICINIMHGAFLDFKNLRNIANSIKKLSLSAIYLADSTGSMDSIEYNSKLKILAQETNFDIGIHAHNNLGKAPDNTLSSISMGSTWLDATILGMGRGPGNTDIEELLISLTPKYREKINIIPLINHSKKWFEKLKEKHKWGKNRFYFLSAKYKIHPSFIQTMLTDSRYSTAEIIGAIDYLKNDKSRTFNSHKLLKARTFFEGKPRGQDAPKNKIKQEKILLLGNSEGILNFKDKLEEFISNENLYVIGINSKSYINQELIDARVFAHPMRLLADNISFEFLNQLIITPYSMLPEKIKLKLKNNRVLDYGLEIERSTMESLKNYCTIPSPIALAYALATLGATDVNNIILAGFDGYPKGDIRNQEVESIFAIFKKKYEKINIYSITPTNYFNVSSKSIYGFNL